MSTFATLVLAGLWSATQTSERVAKSAMGIFEAFLRMLPKEFVLGIEISEGDSSCACSVKVVEVRIVSGELLACPELQPSRPSDSMMWPQMPMRLCLVMRLLPKEFAPVQAGVLRGLARLVDDIARKLRPAGTLDLLAMCNSTGNSIDPDLRSAVGKLGRNSYRMGMAAKNLQVRVGAHYSGVDHAEQQRYWLASRKCMTRGSTHALTVDATRFSKYDWNCGLICNVDEQRFAWIQPVVVFCSHIPSSCAAL